MATFKEKDDIEEDAEPEDTAVHHHRNLQETKSQRNCTTNYNESHTKIADDDEFREYLDIINNEILDDIDILIISDDEDKEDVDKFKKYIQENVEFTIAKTTLIPRVEIFNDIPDDYPTRSLDNATDRALYIFLYLTVNLCAKGLSNWNGHACLRKSLKNKSKRNTVIPVHTSLKKDREYEVDMTLDGLKPLHYENKTFVGVGNKTFVAEVKKLLENKSNVIVNGMMDSDGTKKNYFAENRENIMKLKAFMNSQLQNVESVKKIKSWTLQKDNNYTNADKRTMEDTTECVQLLQSNENRVSQGIHTRQSGFEKEQLVVPDTDYLSKETPLDSLSTPRSTLITEQEEVKRATPQESLNDENTDDLRLMACAVKNTRITNASTQQIPQPADLLNSSGNAVSP